MKLITVFLVIIGLTLGHSTGHIGNEGGSLIDEFSMPDLVNIYENEDELTNNWQGDGQLNEGRYILTRKESLKGEIWNKNFFNFDEFTFEITLRSLGFHGDNNGNSSLTIYLIDNLMELIKFKGLKIKFVNDGQPNVKVYLNDGKNLILNDQFIGSYIIEYQGSNVPITLKFGYSNGLMKMTIDNKLMFETNEIKFPVKDLRFGLVAESIGDEKFEQFELLRLKVYNELTKGLKDKTQESLYANYLSPNSSDKDKNQFNQFNQVEMKLRENLNSQEIKIELNKIQLIINDIKEINIKKIELLKDDINNLNYKIESMIDLFKRQFEMMDSYDLRMGSIDKVLKDQLDKSDSINERFNKFIINKDEEEEKLNSFNNNNNKNNNNLSNRGEKNGYSIVFVLIFIIILLILLSMLIFKLRNDIKHFKVL